MAVCTNCGEENPERAKFCLSCGTPMAQEEAPHEVRKMVSIVFTDLVGSTAMQEKLDPESVRRVMLSYRDVMREVIDKHGGVVEKFIGDAIMCVFGVPLVNEDDALRAVRTAIGMRDALAPLNAQLEETWGVRISVRTGINTGEVLAGEKWDTDTGVLGDTVNTAARFEQAAGAEEILFGPTTYALVKDEVEVEALEPLALKGKTEPVPVYRVVGLKTMPEPLTRSDAPIIGREREVTLLNEALQRAIEEHTCHMFTLLGPAGVGKSRLAAEVLRVAPEDAVAVKGRCLPYGEGITFWPIIEIVKQVAQIDEADSSERAKRKISLIVGDVPDGGLVASIVEQVIGLSDPTASREEIFWGIRKFLELLARRAPLIAIFDDIHWGEPTLLDLIDHIVTWSRTTPIFMLCMARPDLIETRPDWSGGKPNVASVLLEPLTEEYTEALLDSLLGGGAVAPEARARILDASAGNPLFVEEMVSMLIDQGLLARENGHWVPTTDLSKLTVPPTIQALLATRLDRLQRPERQIVERGSVVGRVFTTRGVVQLSPEPLKPQVKTHLTTLERKEFVARDTFVLGGEETFKFRHILIRDAAYNSMPKESRAELHEAFADWLAEILGERVTEQEEILGYHLEQAFRNRAELGMVATKHRDLATRAATHLSSAGQRAIRRGDQPAAVNLLTRALELLPPDDERRLDLYPELGAALIYNGDLAEAQRTLDDAIREAKVAGHPRGEAHAVVQRALLSLHSGEATTFERAASEARQAIELFKQADDPLGLSRAWRLLAYAEDGAGNAAAAMNSLQEAIKHAQRAGDHSAEADARQTLITFLAFGGTPVPAMIKELEEHLAWARSTGSLVTEARALGALGQARAMEGSIEEARDLIQGEKRILEELNAKLQLAWTAFESSAVEMLADNPEGARAELLATYEYLDQIGETATLSTIAALLAEAEYQLGNYDEAARLTHVSEDLSAADDYLTQLSWRSVRAKLLAQRGDADEGERLALEAVEIGAGTDSIDWYAKALLDRGEALTILGKHDAADEARRAALDAYERRGNAAAAQRVSRDLAGTSAPREETTA